MAKAQTRRKKDKDLIDGFIVESVGFEAVDAALTKLAIDSAQAVRERALSTMRIIRLSNCALDASCVSSICELLKGAKTLQACDLRGNPFDEASATAIASAALERSVSLCGMMRKSRSDLVQDAQGGPVRFFPEVDASIEVDLIFAVSDCRVAAAGLEPRQRLLSHHRPLRHALIPLCGVVTLYAAPSEGQAKADAAESRTWRR